MNSFLKEGSEAPDFAATSFDGKPVALSGLVAEGPAVLSFLRGFS